MKAAKFHTIQMVLTCLLLAACAPKAKTPDILNLYELPRAGQGARPLPVDNDSYYRQPTGYKGCATIADAPSCSGGG